MNKVKLSSIIDIISGGTPKTDVKQFWVNGNIGWLSVTDFNNDLRYVYTTEKKITEQGLKNSNTKLLNKGDIIISARGTVGALAQIGTPMCFNQSCFGIRGKREIVETDFLYYSLKNYVHNIKKRSQGSVFDTINLNSFDLMEIEIPKELETQQKIASVLSSLDAKIELNNRINAELEAMAKTLYDYWFVQFDFPDATGKPYKTSGGKMVWNEELKREVPEGWEDERMNTKIKIGSGFPFDSNSYLRSGTYKIITIKNVQDLEIDTNNVDYLDKIPTKISDFCVLKKGDILMSLTGNVGRICLVPEENLLLNQRVGKILCNDLFKNYVYLFFQRPEERIRLEKIATGSSQKNLSPVGAVEDFFLFPPENVLKKFNAVISDSINKTILNIQENQKLTELRDWLLPMLMNGQVKVSEL